MPIYRLSEEIIFPPVDWADPEGILAVGGDLSPERVLTAYGNGIFPWYSPGDPIIWWSPDPRMVLFPSELKISRSMRPILNGNRFRVTFDQAFEQVIEACAAIPRKGQSGTWITEEMKAAYIQLHQYGYAHSVEVWEGKDLVGGLYGESLGSMFFGESMFSNVSNASKAGFITAVKKLEAIGFTLIDCQVHTDHLASMGAREIPRSSFMQYLQQALESTTLVGNWGELDHFKKPI